ncbi:RDD family protein [Streptomyces sp. NPDC057689]|uniref:RDD family protein n=1 Tax=Streptomyces sp. NPDC057689 TaxID=3346213 RepID=UPI003697C181
MSAPTPAPGDESPREGYYPDPSIPGYVRYWNGASWVPGTSRPAPAAVEETGPVFLDDRPDGEGGPEPATAWQADATRQAGFGGDRRVSWGGPGEPESAESADRASDPRVPSSNAGRAGIDGRGAPEPAASAPGPRVPSSNAGRAGIDGRDAPEPAASAPGPRVPSSNAGRAGVDGVRPPQALPAGSDGAVRPNQARPAGSDGVVRPNQARPAGIDGPVQPNQARPALEDGTGAPGAAAHADRAPAGAAPEKTVAIRALRRPGGEPPPTDGTLTIRALDAAPRPPALPAPQSGAAPGAPWAQQGPVSQPAPAPQPAPQAHPHPVPHQAPAPAQQAQPAHQAPAPAPQAQPAPWKPPVDDHFQRLAAARASGRPAPLGKRFAARLIDSVVLGALTAAAAVPLAARAADHIDDKIDAAKLSGETVTVWLLDSTTAALGGALLGVFLVLGVLLDALPTAKWGRTLGKKLCGIDVRDMESHEAPGFGAALRRWLVYAVPGILVVGVAGVLWCLFDRPWRQCWHDKAARTFVAG